MTAFLAMFTLGICACARTWSGSLLKSQCFLMQNIAYSNGWATSYKQRQHLEWIFAMGSFKINKNSGKIRKRSLLAMWKLGYVSQCSGYIRSLSQGASHLEIQKTLLLRSICIPIYIGALHMFTPFEQIFRICGFSVFNYLTSPKRHPFFNSHEFSRFC